MKKYLRALSFLFLLLLPGLVMTAQPLRGDWLIGSGGDYSVNLPWIEVFPDGSVCQAGTFNGTMFSLGSSEIKKTSPNNEIYVARIFHGGGVVWLKSISVSEGYLYLDDVYVDPAGTVYVTGSFTSGTVTLDGLTLTDTVNTHNEMPFIARIAPDGTPQTLAAPFPFKGNPACYPGKILWDDAGNMVISGSFYGDSLYAGDIVLYNKDNSYNSSFFIFCFDASGKPVWGQNAVLTAKGEWGEIMSAGVSFTPGGITIVGTYMGDMRPVFNGDTLPSAVRSNMFLVHYNMQGDQVWVNYSTGDAYRSVSYVVPSPGGEFYIAGNYETGKLSFDTVTIENPLSGTYYYYLCKYDADGKVVWVQNIPAANQLPGKGGAPLYEGDQCKIVTGSAGNIYMSGAYATDVLDLQGRKLTKYAGHEADHFLVKYLPDGTVEWTVSVTSNDVYVPDLAISDEDMLFLTGHLNDTLRFPGGEELGPNDYDFPVYVLKFDPQGNLLNMNAVRGKGYDGMVQITNVNVYAGKKNDVFLSGNYKGAITIDGKELTAPFESNIFLARLSPQTLLTGRVLDATGAPVSSGYVLLYKLVATGQLPVVDSVPVVEDGFYEFHNMLNDQYIIYAFPDTVVYPGNPGTYYPQAAFWSLADTVTMEKDTLGGLDITLLGVTPPDGSGTISGVITREEVPAKSTASIQGEPVKKIKVILIGTKKSSDNIIAWVYTDDQGRYVFQNIPDGSYRIIVDIPGLPQDSTYTVTVSVDNNVISGLDFVVTDKDIQVASSSGTGPGVAAWMHLTVYPNPTQGDLTLLLPKPALKRSPSSTYVAGWCGNTLSGMLPLSCGWSWMICRRGFTICGYRLAAKPAWPG